jgi:hypothetical protein
MLGPYVHTIDPIVADLGVVYFWWYGLGFALGFLPIEFHRTTSAAPGNGLEPRCRFCRRPSCHDRNSSDLTPSGWRRRRSVIPFTPPW